MDEHERCIHLLDTIRKLDYQIIDKKQSEPELAERLRRERDELRDELYSIVPRVVA